MSAILNSLNVLNFLIFQSILMTLVSKFIIHRALSDETYILLGLRSPLKFTYKILSKKANWFLLLALKFNLFIINAKVNPWALFIHTMMGLT